MGQVTSENRNGFEIRYRYDGRGNVSEKEYGDGTRERWVWDGRDQMVRHEDRDGVVTEWEYDEAGNCTGIIRGGERVFTGEYEGNKLVRSVEGNREGVEYGYDERGYLARKTDVAGTERWERDGLGRVVRYEDGAGRVWRYSYGKRMRREQSPLGLVRTYEYNNRKDLVKITERDSVSGEEREQEIRYDKRHLPVEVTDGAGEVTKYTYREDGEVVRKEAGAWVWEYGYEAGGRLAEVRRRKEGSGEEYTERYGYRREGWEEERTVSVGGGGTTVYRIDGEGRVRAVRDGEGETSTRTVTGAGRVTKEQGAHGGFYEYRYDALGRVIEAGREGEAGVRVRYNRDGSIGEKMDRAGNVTAYEYDGGGRVKKEVSGNGERRYEYDGAGRVIREETVSKGTRYYTEWAYDDKGRTVTVTEGGLYRSTWTLNGWGETVRIVDGEGRERRYEYDGAGRVIGEVDGYGRETRYEWNEIGKVERITKRDGTVETYTYNHLGQVTKISDALGTVWEGGYDVAGRLIRDVGRPGVEKECRYDEVGRIIEVRNGGEVVERYRYGNRGREVEYTDGNGLGYLVTKNGYGEVEEERNRVGERQSYGYDGEGRVRGIRGFSGKEERRGYEDGGGITTETYSDGTKTLIERDLRGNVVRAENETGRITYRYDGGGKLVEQIDEGAGEKTLYEYDGSGLRVWMVSGNRDVRYGYGRDGELLWVRDRGQGLEVRYEYDEEGREKVRVYGNGVRQETVYDRAGRVILIREGDGQRRLLRAEGYVYDSRGRRSHSVDEEGKVTKYEYDGQSRVKTVLYPWTEEQAEADKEEAEEAGLYFTVDKGAGERYSYSGEEVGALRSVLNLAGSGRGNAVSTSQLVWRESYRYDRNGNRVSKRTSWGEIAYSYDKENRLVTKGTIRYGHDGDGNLVREQGLRREAAYRYNGRNRLEEAVIRDLAGRTTTTSRYRYDAVGRRTVEQEEGGEVLRTVYDGVGFEEIREGPSYRDGQLTTRSAQGPIQGGTQGGALGSGAVPSNTATGERYRWLGEGQEGRKRGTDTVTQSRAGRYEGICVTLYGRGEAVGMSLSGSAGVRGGSVYLGTDILGSVRSTTGGSGGLEGRYEYDAFGRPYRGDFKNGMDLGYTGKPYDSRTGLYNYGYRDYEPGTGRFTTSDPIRDGSNWFTYVNNDPVNYVDPWGLSASDNDKSTNTIPNLNLTDLEDKTPKTPGQITEEKINEQLEKFGKKIGYEFPDKIGEVVGYAVDLFAAGQPLGNTGINVQLKGNDLFETVTTGRINGTVMVEIKIGQDAGLFIKLPFVGITIPFK